MQPYVLNSKKVKADTVSYKDSCCSEHLDRGQESDMQLDSAPTIPGSSNTGRRCCRGNQAKPASNQAELLHGKHRSYLHQTRKANKMKRTTIFATALAISLAGASLASADSDHGHDNSQGSGTNSGPMATRGNQSDMMRMMMPMMMKMHREMMMHVNQESSGGMLNGMMDRSMMRMMMGDMMGHGAPEDIRSKMLANLGEFDDDKDGNLSLAEFEKLHTAMIREQMVDRFQHLDADGDGQITADEMSVPAKRMQMRQMMNTSPQEEADSDNSDD